MPPTPTPTLSPTTHFLPQIPLRLRPCSTPDPVWTPYRTLSPGVPFTMQVSASSWTTESQAGVECMLKWIDALASCRIDGLNGKIVDYVIRLFLSPLPFPVPPLLRLLFSNPLILLPRLMICSPVAVENNPFSISTSPSKPKPRPRPRPT